MPVKSYNPTSPGRRFQTTSTFDEVTRSTPEKSLVVKLNQSGGRNNRGKITVRYRGGGHRKKYRIIDFRREKLGIPATVAHIEYDPNRSARIALLHYVDGEKRYIVAPLGLKVGDSVMSGPDADIKPGNALPIASIPVGTVLHNVELKKGAGGQLARSAGHCHLCASRRDDQSRRLQGHRGQQRNDLGPRRHRCSPPAAGGLRQAPGVERGQGAAGVVGCRRKNGGAAGEVRHPGGPRTAG